MHQFFIIIFCFVLLNIVLVFIDYLPIQFMLAAYITFIPWNMFVNMNMSTAFKCWHPCRIIWIYAIPTSSTTTTFLRNESTKIIVVISSTVTISTIQIAIRRQRFLVCRARCHCT